MNVICWLLGIYLVLALFVIACAALARDGFEDESGFHAVKPSAPPQDQELACSSATISEHAGRPVA